MLREARGHELEGAVVLGLIAGLRVGEACAIHWRGLDLSTGSRRPWLLLGPDEVRQASRAHAAVLVLTTLRCYRKEQAERLLAVGVRQDEDTFVVTDDLGQQMRPHRLSVAFRRFSADQGFDLPRFHGLRHTEAVLMLTSGTDVKTVASRLGHANPALLFSTYSHYIESADRAAADRLDALLG